MNAAEQITAIAASALTGLVILVAGGRWLHRKWKPVGRKIDQALDAVVGREAVIDKQTGVERLPAVPGIGVRMATLEEAVGALAVSTARLDDHEGRIQRLETGAIERIVGRAESTEAFRLAQQALAAPATPIPDDEPSLEDHDTDL